MTLKVTKFSATWCGPCKTMQPVFDKVAGSTDDVEFSDIDIDDNPELATSMNVMAVPTIVFTKDDVIVDTIVGLAAEQVLRNKIEELK